VGEGVAEGVGEGVAGGVGVGLGVWGGALATAAHAHRHFLLSGAAQFHLKARQQQQPCSPRCVQRTRPFFPIWKK
jgi:hypothetical protein